MQLSWQDLVLYELFERKVLSVDVQIFDLVTAVLVDAFICDFELAASHHSEFVVIDLETPSLQLVLDGLVFFHRELTLKKLDLHQTVVDETTRTHQQATASELAIVDIQNLVHLASDWRAVEFQVEVTCVVLLQLLQSLNRVGSLTPGVEHFPGDVGDNVGNQRETRVGHHVMNKLFQLLGFAS